MAQKNRITQLGKEKEIPVFDTKEQMMDNNLKQQTIAFVFEDIVEIIQKE